MSSYFKSFIIIGIVTSLCVFSSCGDDENIDDTMQDFTINSNDRIEVISTHANGWIREANIKSSVGNLAEFTYHENGYINTASIFRVFPTYHLFSEIERDNANLPVVARYYLADGSLHMTINYTQGIISSKEVIIDDMLSVFTYENGLIATIEKNNDNESTSVSFNYTDQTRTVTIQLDGNTIFDEVFPITDEIGFGVNTNVDIPLGNFLENAPVNDSRVLTSSSTSLNYDLNTNIREFAIAPVVYDQFNLIDENLLDIRLLSNDNDYRGYVEQYPFFEENIMVSQFRIVENRLNVLPDIVTREEIGRQIEDDAEGFQQSFGNEFNNEIFFGKYFVIVGTLRNLPSDDNLRNRIQDIAIRKARNIVGTSNDEISTAEQELLSNVFFELKAHSPSLMNSNGVVITTSNQFNQIANEVNAAQNGIIQRIFRDYSFIALNPN